MNKNIKQHTANNILEFLVRRNIWILIDQQHNGNRTYL